MKLIILSLLILLTNAYVRMIKLFTGKLVDFFQIEGRKCYRPLQII